MTTTQPSAGAGGQVDVGSVVVAHRPDDTGDAFDPTALPPVTLGYVAGFDGLRALGLLTILAYHHGIAAARGGIFTVSMFFTLSGFLIASLALVERSRTGAFSMSSFWERRVRRLLPAAVVTVVAIVALQHLFEVGSSSRFRGDLLGALAYVANWRLAYSGGDYASAFSLEAPTQHFWSLAVEEQFYLAFPLAFVGLLALSRGRWRRVGAVLGIGAAASFAAAWVTAGRHGNSGLAYYATYTRASEILVGVALAFAVQTRPARRVLAAPGGAAAARWAGVVGLVGLAVLWHKVGLADPFVFRGGTLLNATFTSLVVLACVSPAPGRVAGLLGTWPLRNLGKVSYGVYLFHWPLFLFLDHERTGLGRWSLFVVRVVVAIGLAALSYHVIERPFRSRGGRWSGRRLVATLALPVLAVVALVMVVPVHRSGATLDLAEAELDFGPAFPDEVVPAAGAAPVARVLLVGDSLSWSMLSGFETWNAAHPDQAMHVDSYRAVACTLAESGIVRSLGRIEHPTVPCRKFRDELPEMLAANDYDVVVLTMGHKDLSERQVGGEWRHFGDPVFDEWWRGQAAGLADILAAERAPVLWTSATRTRIIRPEDPSRQWDDYGDNDPARVDRLNAIVADLVAERPGFQVTDVSGWLQSQPDGEGDTELRADGVHWFPEASDRLAEWLAPQIIEAAGADLP
ncbi:MAG TPA: acyltransferase family protein [Acidimicrobiales bacterium]